MPYKQPHSVLVLIHTDDGEVLLLERRQHRGFWQSVTGSREGEETDSDTAIREVFEETGLIVLSADLIPWPVVNRFEIYPLWRDRYPPGVTYNEERVFSFNCRRRQPIILANAEHLAFQWCDWSIAAGRVFSWTNRDALLQFGWSRTN